MRTAQPNPGIGALIGHLGCVPRATQIAPLLFDMRTTGEIAMLAAHWPPPGPGATGVRSIDVRTKKADRLDLLARVIHLRTDCVELALSTESAGRREQEGWDTLFDQAELLGQAWAAADPVDARKLLPSLLTGLRDVQERFEHAYDQVALGLPEDEHVRRTVAIHASAQRNGICDSCDSNVTFLLNDNARKEAIEACPCCGQSWES